MNVLKAIRFSQRLFHLLSRSLSLSLSLSFSHHCNRSTTIHISIIFVCVFSFCSTIWTIFEHFPSFILLRYSCSMWFLLLLLNFFGNFSTFITFLGVSFALILVSFLWSFFSGYFRIFFIASLIPGTWHCDPYWVLINWKKKTKSNGR